MVSIYGQECSQLHRTQSVESLADRGGKAWSLRPEGARRAQLAYLSGTASEGATAERGSWVFR